MARGPGETEAGGRPESRAALRAVGWWDWTRITTVRVLVQALTFGLFLSFVLLTTFAHLDRRPGLRHWCSKLLEIDPLISLSTALTTHTVYRGLLWSLIVLVPTLFLGRFFCNWICPYGTLHQFVGWAFGKKGGKDAGTRCTGRGTEEGGSPASERDTHPNRYRPGQRVKYYVLIALLGAAALGSLQIGLLDPICLLYRSLTGAVLPVVSLPAPSVLGEARVYQGAWLIGFLLFGLVAMNLAYPRFFCRVLCPLGALLGLLSRWAWWRIERAPERCGGCDLCRRNCEGACDPHATLRQAECLVCFNCVDDCPQGALRFAFFPPREHVAPAPDLERRKVVLAGVTGLLFYPLVRTSGRSTRDFSSRLIRPPGAVEELEFLERCVKCGQCLRVCPTNVVQPAWLEGGVEGLWTPVMNFRVGHCQLHCTACGYVCPTGAIRHTTIPQKLGLGEFAERGPIRLGTAHVDPGRCLPYSAGVPCQVCEEVCPTSPKAIRTERHSYRARRGRRWANADRDQPILVPRVDPDLCIGCGLCERECPVIGDQRAIYVTAEGETRSQDYPERDRNRSVRLGG